MTSQLIRTPGWRLPLALSMAVLTSSVTTRGQSTPTTSTLLVKWKDGPTNPAAVASNARIGAKVKRNFSALGWQWVELPPALSPAEGLQAYQALDAVALVELDRRMPVVPTSPSTSESPPGNEPTSAPQLGLHGPALAGITPNDPTFNQQWYLKKIGATNAWATTTGSPSVVVAVFDTGTDYTHPDLAANMWRNPGETGLDAQGHDKATNGMDDDADGYVDDVHGINVWDNTGDPLDTGYIEPPNPLIYHGTGVAGVIGAVGNNGRGLVGVNWSVQIMSLKVDAGDNSTNGLLEFYSAGGILTAYNYLLEMKRRGVNVRVASHSEGLVAYGAAVREAIETAGAEGVLTVVAADNHGFNHDLFSTFANVQNLASVIYVAATDQADQLTSWSDYGKSTVHLAAPGVNILTTAAGASYQTVAGTSFACPLVSGAAALVLAAYPGLTVDQLKAVILGSVDPLAGLRNKVITGGRLNVARALELAADADAPAIVVTALPAGQRTPAGSSLDVTFSRPMNPGTVESGLVIMPPVPGAFEWSSDHRSFRFHHDTPFDRTATYTVRIPGSVQDESGAALDGNFNRAREGSPADDFVWTFRFPVANDNFSDAQPIEGVAGSIRGDTRYTLCEVGEPTYGFPGGPYALASVWYRWTSPEAGWFTFDLTSGTAFDSYLAVHTGAALDRLDLVAANENYGAKITSRLSLRAEKGVEHSIAVLGKSGTPFPSVEWGSFTLTWYPTLPPGFTGSPFSPLRGMPGAKVVLTGTNFTGATAVLFGQGRAVFANAPSNNVDLSLTATVPPDAVSGPITVVTPHGSVTSTATFQVLPPPLSIAPLADGDVEIRWAATSEAMVLEEVEDLTAGGWRPVGTVPQRAESQSAVRLAPTRPTFYRLKAD